MKRVVFTICILVFAVRSMAVTITWDGEGGDGQWATATNWAGDIVPGFTDDVLLNNAIVAGSYTVTLPAGNSSVIVNSLTITPSGSNTILLLNPAGNTSPTAFTATGAGDAIVLNNGAIFKNSSGASSGTPVGVTTSNFFRINNGGRYIHNCDRAHTTTLVARLSSAPGTENGTFEFDVPSASFTFSFSGRVYGNLEFSSATHGGPLTYVSLGSLVSAINGNLVINTGVTLTFDYTNDILINGNLIQSASSTLNLSNNTGNTIYKIKGNISSGGTITETGSGLPEIQMMGNTNQSIMANGTISNSITVNINNAAGVTLQSSVSLSYKLQLTNGIVKTTPAFLLTLLDNAISSAGSPVSFINGPMKKAGDEGFVFPVGEGTEYAPVEISGGGASNDEFIAQYFRGNPQYSIGGNYENPPVDHMSALEWWTLDRKVGSSSKNVTLSVRGYSDVTLTSQLVVMRWNGTMWRNEGRTAYTGVAMGTVTSVLVTGFFPGGTATAFTLGSEAPFPVNPLPVTIKTFDALKLSGGKASINWEMGGYSSNDTKFEIQRAGPEKNFKTIGIVPGSTTNLLYHFLDHEIINGISYYRLKITDGNRSVVYSRIATIMNNAGALPLISLVPTIVTTKAVLRVALSSMQTLNFFIVDMAGRTVWKQHLNVNAGNTDIELVISGLSPGLYQLMGFAGSEKTNLIRFFKQ